MSGARVSVAIAVALDRAFTYAVPATWPVTPPPGTRVLAPLGTRVMVGVVRPEPPEPTDEAKLRELVAVLDPDEPALPLELAKLCEWVADYYVAPIGEVYRAALPGLLTHADARVVTITDAGRAALTGGPLLGGVELDRKQAALLEAIASVSGGLPMTQAIAAAGKSGGSRMLAALEQAGLVEIDWEPDDEMRTETWVRRTDALREGASEPELQRAIGRSKQRRMLLDQLERKRGDPDEGWVSLAELRSVMPRARELLVPLEAAQLVELEQRARTLDPFGVTSEATSTPQAPTADQARALAELRERVAEGRFASALLQGITGSGKTEVYLQLIADVRARGKDAIVLVPEIALTPQLADRFRARFGEEVAVLHSGLTPRQRLDAWQQIRRGLRPIVIGARSAVFAPLPRLGAIVVDEEHDPSFKQEEGVRYHGRDVALVRAQRSDAIVVLGSATPSLESYANARAGRYQWLRLNTRPTPRPLPEVEIVPLSVHRPDPETLLSARLRQALAETVALGEQAILFLNRRGFTTTLVCEMCGSMQQCPDCSAPSMTYHLQRHRLMCHLCGHIEATPDRCSHCGHAELSHGGVGTERVELALVRELAGARVLRLDRDAARGRALFETLAAFRRREADVLVGTQMLSKGHDFPGVTLVGILQGDHGLALPDIRSAERTFQLLTQVAGRAGRGDRPGRVLVQAWAVDHPAIRFAQQHDHDGFAAVELAARRELGNPPSGFLALVRVHGLDPGAVSERARALGRRLTSLTAEVRRKHSDDRIALVLGPVPSPIERIDRRTRWQLLIRARERGPMRWILGELRPHLGADGSGARATIAMVDVDPQSML